MRTRAPDSSVVRGNEVTSSNNTLNTFLGGRQKSWMTGDGSIVRPSPRAAVTQKSVAGVLPSPAPSDEPSPPLQQPRETTPSDILVNVQLPVPGLPRQEYTYDGAMAEVRIAEPLMNAAVFNPAHNNAELEPPLSEISAMSVGTQNGVPRDRHPQQPLQRRQNAIPAQSSLPSLKGHILIIDQHIELTGQFQPLDQALDRPRFNLLRDACNNQDYFYVALHQVFCLWTTDREIVLGLEVVGDIRAVAIAFQILSQLIRENEQLSHVHLKWFSQFPSPLLDLTHRSKHYRQALSDVFDFLHKLTADWGPLTSQCQSRGYPPLVDELVHRLGLFSPVLQGVFFTATRRNLGVTDDEFGAQMEKTFALDRDKHRELAARYNTAYPPSEQEVAERNNSLASRYLTIRHGLLRSQAEYRAHQQAPAANSVARESHSAPSMLSQPEHNVLRSSNPGQLSSNQSHIHPTTFNSFIVPSQTLSSDGTPLRTPLPFISVGNASSQQNGLENRNPQLLSQSPISPVPGGFQWHPSTPRGNHNPNLQTSPPLTFPGSVPATQFLPSQFVHPQHQQMMATQQTQVSPQIQTSQLQPAQMQQNQMQQAHTQQAQMQQAHVQQTQMQQAQMRQAQMQQAPMQQVHTQQAQTHQSHTQQAHTQQAHTQQAQMQQAQMQQVQTQQAHTQQAHAPQAHTQQAQMHQAQMFQQAQMMQQSHLLQARLAQQNIPQQSRVARHDSMQVHIPSDRTQPQANDNSAAQLPPSQSSRNGSLSGGPLTPISDPSSAQQSFQQAPMLSSMQSGQRLAGHHQLQSYVQVPSDRLLVPPLGYVPPLQLPNPDFTTLHQAHLRSPHMVVGRSTKQLPSGGATGRHYQAVKGFVVDPTVLSLDRPLSKFQFMVPAPIYKRIASDKLNSMTSPPTREVTQGSLQLRMRCIQIKRGTKRCDPSEWVVADTVWPPSVFLEINDEVLEVRRKSHHAKDLPVDITPYVIGHGVDQISRIRISIPRVNKTPKEIKYAFAVELVEILGHQQILNMCLKQRIAASETLQNIKRSLSGSLDDEDDEIAMVVSDLTVDLADPFMATIFNVPVRGSRCLHRECFDLETFLNTRNSKPRRPDQPCMVDVWKCPLCGNDARPYSLRVDEFLVSVRETLARDDNLDVKAILVAADGTWKPKPEPLNQKRKASITGLSTGFDSDSNDEMKPSIKRRQTEEVEIIDLDDDWD